MVWDRPVSGPIGPHRDGWARLRINRPASGLIGPPRDIYEPVSGLIGPPQDSLARLRTERPRRGAPPSVKRNTHGIISRGFVIHKGISSGGSIILSMKLQGYLAHKKQPPPRILQ